MRWRKRKAERTKAEVIAGIRQTLAWFGPIEDFTDEEIEQGVALFGRLTIHAGCTAEAASDALVQMARAGVRHG